MKAAASLANKMVLGTVQFGMDYGISNTRGKVSLEEVCRILEYAHAAGITTLDTAAAYGESETALGRALQETQLSFKVISKLPPIEKAADVRQKLEESLQKLNLERLDGYMIHNFGIFQNTPQVMEELYLLQAEKLINKVGVSLYHPEEADELLDKNVDFQITQFPYNVFDQRFAGMLPKLQQHEVEVHTRSAFLQGLFFMNPAALAPHFAGAKPALEAVQQLAGKEGIPLEALLLNFVLSQPGIDKVTIGVNSLKDLQQNLKAEVYMPQVQELLTELSAYQLTDENILLPFKWKTA